VTSCSQLEDLDAMAMGELDARRARELRTHAATCPACTAELDMLATERALFAARAEALAPPVAFVPREAFAPREVFDSRSAMKIGRLFLRRMPLLGRLAMRGHFTAACAAALFVVAALSRVGASSMAMSKASDDRALSASSEASEVGAGMFASYLEREPLACAPSTDDGVMTSSFSGVSGASGASRASRDELLACVVGGALGGGALESASGGVSCEPSVTWAGLRQ
jgi:anti-sigma factor RsiW